MQYSLLLALFVAALVYAEVAVYCVAHKHRVIHAAVAAIVLIAALVLDYTYTPVSWAQENKPVSYFLVNVWLFAAPLVAMSAASLLVAKLDRAIGRHMVIVLLAAALTLVWPIFALYSVCASGVDCI